MRKQAQWRPVCEEAALSDGTSQAMTVAGQPILLVRHADAVYALHNRCPHLGCPLTRGLIGGYVLTCPCHDWTFDIRSGEFPHAREIKVPTFETRAASGSIYVKL
jgi:3-phenylpropionate/trans-cinnamate dioxygenase ferredoxin subunit